MRRGGRESKVEILAQAHQFFGQCHRRLEGDHVVLHTVDDEQVVAQVGRILQRTARECLRMRLWATADGHVVASEEEWVDGRRRGDTGSEEPGLLQERIHGERAAVAGAPDAHALAVHVGERLQVVHRALDVVQVAPAPVHQELLAEVATVPRASPHVHLNYDVAALDDQVLLQPAEARLPPVADGIGVHGAEDHRIRLRAIKVRRFDDARVQREVFALVPERYVARRDPGVGVELRRLGGGDTPGRASDRCIGQVEFGGGDIVGGEQGERASVGGEERCVDAGTRRQSRTAGPLVVCAPDVPLVGARLRRHVQDVAGGRHGDARAGHIERAGGDRCGRRGAARCEEIDLVVVLEVAAEKHVFAVAVPRRGDVVVDAGLPMVVPDLRHGVRARVRQIQPAVDGIVRLLIDQERPRRRPREGDHPRVCGLGKIEETERACLHIVEANRACFVRVSRVAATQQVHHGRAAEVVGNGGRADAAPVHVVYRDVAAVRRPRVDWGCTSPRGAPDFHVMTEVRAQWDRADGRHADRSGSSVRRRHRGGGARDRRPPGTRSTGHRERAPVWTCRPPAT